MYYFAAISTYVGEVPPLQAEVMANVDVMPQVKRLGIPRKLDHRL